MCFFHGHIAVVCLAQTIGQAESELLEYISTI